MSMPTLTSSKIAVTQKTFAAAAPDMAAWRMRGRTIAVGDGCDGPPTKRRGSQALP